MVSIATAKVHESSSMVFPTELLTMVGMLIIMQRALEGKDLGSVASHPAADR